MISILAFACIVAFCANNVAAIVGGITAAPPPPDDPVVFVRLYSRDARVEGIRNLRTGLYSFLGIRYAKSPTGLNRFLRPEYQRLKGDINATRYGPPCPQPQAYYPQRVIGDENCLHLNVFSPKMPDGTDLLPVIIWIHGGGFRYGSASQYGPDPLTAKNVLFVPIQYRLGSLGLIGDGTRDFSGNVALFDMTAALRWVKEYISFFGGDPSNIKVMGQGSGAASAMYLSISQLPEHVTGVIAMSGNALTNYAIDEAPVQSTEDIALINNCPTVNETEILRCMRKKTVQEIILNDSKVQTDRLAGRNMIKAMSAHLGVAPVIERPDDRRGLPGFITASPRHNIKNGTFRSAPLLTGVTKDETANGIDPKEIETIFKSLDNFLGSLKSILNLNEFLNINNMTGQLLTPKLPGVPGLNLQDYLKIPKDLEPKAILSKLIEATTDAFFNLPAFLTVQEWSKKAPSFLYSFEYAGKTTSGQDFLSGLPLVSRTKKQNAVAHGDELGYLFDACDIYGQPLNNSKLTTKEDIAVRNSFTKLIADFAAMKLGDGKKAQKAKGIFGIFEPKGNSFIRINQEVAVETDFRFCELSLWGAKTESLKTTTCKALTDGLVNINNLAGNVGGLLAQSGKSIGNKKPPGILGGLGLG